MLHGLTKQKFKSKKNQIPNTKNHVQHPINPTYQNFPMFLELIPRPARACQDPPLYLRLRMGRPIGKAMPLPTAVMSYGKNKLKTEFIFSIPKNRTDELYRFLNTWVPHLYGELDEEQITARGFELIQHDTEWVKGGQSKVSVCGGVHLMANEHSDDIFVIISHFKGWPDQ